MTVKIIFCIKKNDTKSVHPPEYISKSVQNAKSSDQKILTTYPSPTVRRREVGLTNDYPRLDESLSVLVERFPPLQPLAGAEFLNNGTLYPSMKAAI